MNARLEDAVTKVETETKKTWARNLWMVPVVAGIVVAGIAFGLPLWFTTKKTDPEALPESTPLPSESKDSPQ